MATELQEADGSRRLALTLSGAVSLGSFEAGVLTELLYALEYWWTHDGPRYRLDVLTGASAGAITGGLVARALYNRPDREHLYRAWVEDIDIRLLVQDPPLDAVLGKRVVEEIADSYLGPPPASPSPTPMAPKTLRLYFALSNMYGMPYAFAFKSGGQDARFETEFFSDGQASTVTPKTTAAAWKTIRECAIASASFPIAFAPAYLARDRRNYPGNLWDPFPDAFPCVDGGLFNNEPIKFMVDLARDADGGSLASGRKFLLVDANLNKWRRWQRPYPPKAATAILGDVLRLLGMIRGEASALDYLQAQRRNSQIAWRDRLLQELVPMIRQNALRDPAPVVARLEAAAREIVDEKRAHFPGRYPAGYLEEALERTAVAHQAALRGLGDATGGRTYTLIAFLINSIAGLDKKGALDIDVIYAPQEQMAGRLLEGFGGFFSRDWRLHDYHLGRRHAHDELPRILDGPPYEREPTASTPSGGPEYEPVPIDPARVSFGDTDLDSRKAFRDAVLAKATPIVDAFHLGPWPVSSVAKSLIKSKLSHWLEKKLCL